MFGTNHKGIGAIIAVVVAFMLMPVTQAQVQAQSTGITGSVENVGSALSGMVEGLTNTLSSDFIMDIVASISTRIGRVLGAGLFVASTDNIFFRVLEWIVAFTMNIFFQILWLVLSIIYIIPCVSVAGIVTQTIIPFECILPLTFGSPLIFADNVEDGFNWLTLGSGGFASCFAILGSVASASFIPLFLVYDVMLLIPILNSIASIIGIIVGVFAFVIVDVMSILLSAYEFLILTIPSALTDCVIIARAMCRACLGV